MNHKPNYINLSTNTHGINLRMSKGPMDYRQKSDVLTFPAENLELVAFSMEATLGLGCLRGGGGLPYRFEEGVCKLTHCMPFG